jgi:lysophospholipase L1-like esterase
MKGSSLLFVFFVVHLYRHRCDRPTATRLIRQRELHGPMVKHPAICSLTGVLLWAALVCGVVYAPVAYADVHVGNIKADRILFLGNSLTYHPPKPEIGWSGNWGMAASEEAKDYAHLIASHVAGVNAGKQPAMLAVNIVTYGGWEQNYGPNYNVESELKTLLDWQPDVVFVQLGDNSTASLTSDEAKTAFARSFETVLAAFKNKNQPKIFVVSTFWPTPTTDALLRQACTNVGGTFVDISGLYGNLANRGGWGGHPSDAGMAAMADTVWSSMRTHSAPESGTLSLLVCATMSLAVCAWRKRKLERATRTTKTSIFSFAGGQKP